MPRDSAVSDPGQESKLGRDHDRTEQEYDASTRGKSVDFVPWVFCAMASALALAEWTHARTESLGKDQSTRSEIEKTRVGRSSVARVTTYWSAGSNPPQPYAPATCARPAARKLNTPPPYGLIARVWAVIRIAASICRRAALTSLRRNLQPEVPLRGSARLVTPSHHWRGCITWPMVAAESSSGPQSWRRAIRGATHLPAFLLW